MDGDITKRMGVNIGKPFVIGDTVEGNKLPIYQIGAGTEGRYFSGEAGGSGRLTAGCGAGRAYTIGETGVNRLVDIVNKASEVSSE